jgi:hypothetical protein
MKEAMKMLSALKDPALFVGCSFETSEGLQVLPDGERMWAAEVTVKKNGKVLQRISNMVPEADFDPSKEIIKENGSKIAFGRHDFPISNTSTKYNCKSCEMYKNHPKTPINLPCPDCGKIMV